MSETALAPASPSEPTTFERSVLLWALLFSACRFVPVPLADEWLQAAIMRQLVRRALSRHGRTYPVEWLRSLYEPPSGCLSGCLLAAPKLLLKIILFPLRKLLSWLGAARGVTRDLVRALLLSRTIERCLARGRLAGDQPAVTSDALEVRAAFERALEGSELGLTRAAIASVLAHARGLLARAARAATRAKPDASGAPELEGSPEVQAAAAALESALMTPEIASEIGAFDARLDAALTLGASVTDRA